MARKDGYWQGWIDYRFGGQERPATHRQLIKQDKRAYAVQSVMDHLQDWRSSPFESEGAIVAGLRSALCIQGHRWPLADLEAKALVTEALGKLGIRRPSWEEGQREYSIPVEDCRWCGMAIADDGNTRAPARFCSSLCARASFTHREYENKWWEDSKGLAAYRVLRKEKTTARNCKHCGDAFKPLRDKDSSQFCSLKCSQRNRRTIPERECKQCKTVFRPDTITSPGMFCSRACCRAYNDGLQFERHCLYCGCSFMAKSDHTMYCSSSHRGSAWKVEKRKRAKAAAPGNVVYLTLEIFDSWFAQAA